MKDLELRNSSLQKLTLCTLLIRAFTGVYWDNHVHGTYRCIVCNQELFSSSKKFESGSGWPSFYDIIQYGAVKEIVDTSLGMKRTEVVCTKVSSLFGSLLSPSD